MSLLIDVISDVVCPWCFIGKRRLMRAMAMRPQIPFDVKLREGGDRGEPIVVAAPDSDASNAIHALATQLATRPRGLAGVSLGLTPTNG